MHRSSDLGNSVGKFMKTTEWRARFNELDFPLVLQNREAEGGGGHPRRRASTRALNVLKDERD